MRKRLQKAARLGLGAATLGGIGLVGAFGAGAAAADTPGFGSARLRSSGTSISMTTRPVRTRSAVSTATWTVPSRRLRRLPS